MYPCVQIVPCVLFLDSFLFFLYAFPFTIFITIFPVTASVYTVSKSLFASSDLLSQHHFLVSNCLVDTPFDFHADLSKLVSLNMKYPFPKLTASPRFPNSVGDSPTPLAICINCLLLLQQIATRQWLKTAQIYSLTVLWRARV